MSEPTSWVRRTATWVEIDLGDAEFKVLEFSDGLFAVRIDDTQLLCNASQMQDVLAALVTLAKAKQWL
jgi:hypothetical protein